MEHYNYNLNIQLKLWTFFNLFLHSLNEELKFKNDKIYQVIFACMTFHTTLFMLVHDDVLIL